MLTHDEQVKRPAQLHVIGQALVREQVRRGKESRVGQVERVGLAPVLDLLRQDFVGLHFFQDFVEYFRAT